MVYKNLFAVAALLILGVLGVASLLLMLDLVGFSPF